MKAMAIVKTIALAILLAFAAQKAAAQTEQQIAEMNKLSAGDWTDTLDYCDWLLDAQFWMEHSDSAYGKQFWGQLQLSADDEAAFRNIVADFGKRHDELMADEYAKIDRGEWTTETQTKLVEDLVNATNDATKTIQTKLSAEGARKVDDVARRGGKVNGFGVYYDHKGYESPRPA